MMTCGEIYEKDKQHYDSLAHRYISDNLEDVGDVAYVPNCMKTYYTRRMVGKVGDDKYALFSGLTAFIETIDSKMCYPIDRIDTSKTCTYDQLVETIGFEYSINPRFAQKDSK